MICKGCGADAPKLRITFEKGRKIEGCQYCNPAETDVLMFNYIHLGAAHGNPKGMTAAHIRDIKRRKVHEDWSNIHEPNFSAPYQDYRKVHFDMGRR